MLVNGVSGKSCLRSEYATFELIKVILFILELLFFIFKKDVI